MDIAIERLSGPTADARELIAELDAVLGGLYEAEQRHGLSIEQVFQPNVRFFAARIGGAAVGCGAVALFDDYAEVKRMYTREAARGQGVGKALLGVVEGAEHLVQFRNECCSLGCRPGDALDRDIHPARSYTRSITVAMPWPTPTHIATRA